MIAVLLGGPWSDVKKFSILEHEVIPMMRIRTPSRLFFMFMCPLTQVSQGIRLLAQIRLIVLREQGKRFPPPTMLLHL